jgi:hypothetical protein
MLLFNLVVTLICFWVIFKINTSFIQPARWNRYRFRLFELRDNLALLAMKGQISEKSDEYIALMSMFNRAVNETNKFQAVRFLRFLHTVKSNKKLQGRIEEILRKMDSENKEYQSILRGYFEVVHRMFMVQTKSFYRIAPPLIFVLGCCNFLASTTSSLRKKLELVDKIDDDFRVKKEILSHAHA